MMQKIECYKGICKDKTITLFERMKTVFDKKSIGDKIELDMLKKAIYGRSR